MITLDLNCTRCQRQFPVSIDVYRSLDMKALPKRCPTCCDQLQGRPDVVLERQVVSEWTVRIHASFAAMFGDAHEFQPLPTDIPTRRLTVKGRVYGVSWSGRIDLWSHVWPVETGDVLDLAHLKVRRKVWYVAWSRKVMYDTRPVPMSRRVPPDYQVQGNEQGPLEREEVNEYVLLTRTLGSTAARLQQDALPALVWLEAYSKTTLKGLGRQFSRKITGTPLWSQSVSGGCRSGRYGTHAMLAVVDPLDPLTLEESGDVEGTDRQYP